ncbi:conserved hypothetical protein [Thermosulfidibacter takaii ABI70S6]|uniref:Diadenylate cyclase n=2 Tax=Thermosulfidibacter takaii TaxID=412593 RepID=A0A0S3QV08_THET7|nr:conserved hypothetical protein [Thermosulfidibacter takaii ABI70S6]
MTIRDVIDIFVVSVIVYQLIKIVRGTKAFRMLLGLLFLVLLSFLAKWFQLKTLSWLFQNFWQVGVLVVVILFQPELRKGLADVGRIYPLGPTFKETMVVDSVVEACAYFASRKIGALIVFERDMGLKNYIESGIILDAVVSEELLISIFLPYSPLHDGAVIIRNDRIAAAACLLPLSSDPMISKALGTRHRAAIGLTEETDAVVVVVSEETGIISIAVNGQIRRDLDKETLRGLLMDLLYSAEKSKLGLFKKNDNQECEAR